MTKSGKHFFICLILAVICFALCLPLAACGEPDDVGGGGNGGGGGGSGLPTGQDPYVLSVEITNMPHRTEYTAGEKFVPAGLTFDAKWNVDGEEVVIDMNYSDCDGWTPREEPLTVADTKVVFTLEGFEFEVPIKVEAGQPDLPVEDLGYTKLAISTNVDNGSSSAIKENGKYSADEVIVYDHRIYTGITEYKVSGNLENNANYRTLNIQGGGLAGTKPYTEGENEITPAGYGTRTKVHYLFKNTGSNPVTFRFYYDSNGVIGASKAMRLTAGETTVTEFVVETDKAPGNKSDPWVKIELLANTNETTLAVAGYDAGKLAAGSYDLSLENAEFADGKTSALLAAGAALPEGIGYDKRASDTFMGWVNAYDLSEKWIADGDGNVDFVMPDRDVLLRPLIATTGYQALSLKPRTTSGGKRPELHNGKDNTARGEANYATDGYSEEKVKYTIYPQAKDDKVISGNGNHFGNDDTYDRVFKLTFTRLEGDVDFRYWVDFNYEKYLVKNITSVRVTLNKNNTRAEVYIVVPKGMPVNGNNEANFCMDILEAMNGNAVFEATCEYARLA